jgi:hypothetical protein
MVSPWFPLGRLPTAGVSTPWQLAASPSSLLQPDTDGVAVVPSRPVANRRVSPPWQLAASPSSRVQPDTDGVAVVPSRLVANRRDSPPQQLAASVLSCAQPDTTSVAAFHCWSVSKADPAGSLSSFLTDGPARAVAASAGAASAGAASAGAANAGPESFFSSASVVPFESPPLVGPDGCASDIQHVAVVSNEVANTMPRPPPWPLRPVSSSPLAVWTPSDDGS